MTTTIIKKNPYDKTSTKRQNTFLARLKEGGGGSVRVDLQGEDLNSLDDLVSDGVGASRAEVIRALVRKEHAKLAKKK
jgi:hypothetical protein